MRHFTNPKKFFPIFFKTQLYCQITNLSFPTTSENINLLVTIIPSIETGSTNSLSLTGLFLLVISGVGENVGSADGMSDFLFNQLNPQVLSNCDFDRVQTLPLCINSSVQEIDTRINVIADGDNIYRVNVICDCKSYIDQIIPEIIPKTIINNTTLMVRSIF